MEYLRWISENGKMRQVYFTEAEIAERELATVARKLHRMTTPKSLYRPLLKGIKWSPPSPSLYRGYVKQCRDCGRDCQGQHCRECWNKRQWATYRTKRRADDKRLRNIQKAFSIVAKRKEQEMKEKKLPVSPITRSTSGLRAALFDEMEALRSGSSNAQRARSIAMMANSILQSVQVEIEYHKYVKSNHGRIEGDQKVVALGTDISLAA